MYLSEYIKVEFNRRVIIESLSRIEKCLSLLSMEQIWYRHNDNTNPIGNLVLHLAGNVTQYILAGIGGQPDTRKREQEFNAVEQLTKEQLINIISSVLTNANQVVQSLSQNDFDKSISVQGFEENVVSVVIHVIEHLSYHVGQITYYTKYIENIDTGYYAGLDLNVTD